MLLGTAGVALPPPVTPVAKPEENNVNMVLTLGEMRGVVVSAYHREFQQLAPKSQSAMRQRQAIED
jgi:hypothetical protein